MLDRYTRTCLLVPTVCAIYNLLNAPKIQSNSAHFTNFLGEACPQTPWHDSALHNKSNIICYLTRRAPVLFYTPGP